MDACVFADSCLIRDMFSIRRLTDDGGSSDVYDSQQWCIVGFTADSRGCVLVLQFSCETCETRLVLLSSVTATTKTRVLMTKDMAVGV